MRKVKLQIEIENSNEKCLLETELNSEDWNTLESYYNYSNDLFKTSFVKNGMRSSLNVKFEIGKAVKIKTYLPPWDEVVVFLHKARPLLLESEHASFNKVCGLLGSRFESEYLRKFLKNAGRIYRGKKLQSSLLIKANGVLINSEKVLFDWLNSYEYHRDQAKRKKIDDLHKLFPLEASQVIFIGLLTEKVKAIINVANFISVVLNKTECSTMIRF